MCVLMDDDSAASPPWALPAVWMMIYDGQHINEKGLLGYQSTRGKDRRSITGFVL